MKPLFIICLSVLATLFQVKARDIALTVSSLRDFNVYNCQVETSDSMFIAEWSILPLKGKVNGGKRLAAFGADRSVLELKIKALLESGFIRRWQVDKASFESLGTSLLLCVYGDSDKSLIQYFSVPLLVTSPELEDLFRLIGDYDMFRLVVRSEFKPVLQFSKMKAGDEVLVHYVSQGCFNNDDVRIRIYFESEKVMFSAKKKVHRINDASFLEDHDLGVVPLSDEDLVGFDRYFGLARVGQKGGGLNRFEVTLEYFRDSVRIGGEQFINIRLPMDSAYPLTALVAKMERDICYINRKRVRGGFIENSALKVQAE